MDLKKEAAKYAVNIVKSQTVLGLGGGSTISWLIKFLAEERKEGLEVRVITSSPATRLLLEQNEFDVLDAGSVGVIDLYLDGCDQFDKNLHALKSGGGIHTMEKLLATMSKEFVLVGDESKYAVELSTKIPVTLEVIPESLGFIQERMRRFPRVGKVSVRRQEDDSRQLTVHGNYLFDVWFEQWPPLSQINPSMKAIPGVLETSLFYDMAHRAIVAGANGIQIMEKPAK